MKTRLLPLVFIVSFLLPVPDLRAASGDNPDVFTPTANQTTIQTSFNVSAPDHPHIHTL